MKKTIIALLALGSMAMATQTEDLTVTSTTIGLDTEALTLTLTGIDGASTGTIDTDAFTGAEGFSPKIQFVQGANDGCYWDLSLTITNKTENTITLTGMTLDMFSTTGSGGNHAAGIQDTEVTLTLGDVQFGSGVAVLGANSASDTATITGTYELAAGATEEISLRVQRTKAGAYTGFASISGGTLSYAVVPEPATATLSLLALAGLAARRRR